MGGILPVGSIPFPANGNTAGQHVLLMRGHEAKGQDKIVSDLHATVAASKVFSLGVTVNNAALANGDTQTAVKISQKIDTNTGRLTLPAVQVSQLPSKQAITKGTVEALPASDKFGAQTGSHLHSAELLNAVPSMVETYDLVIPSSAAGADTFKLDMKFPAPINFLGDPTTANINANASAATIATALQTAFALTPGGGGISVSGTTMSPGATNGSFLVNMTSVNAGIATALGNPYGNGRIPALPPLSALPTNQSAGLQAAQLDDGSLSSGLRYGGVDPSLDPVVDFGNNVFVAQGLYSSGPIPGPLLKNTGKTSFAPDSQALFLQYPASVVDLSGVGVPTALLLLQAAIGPNLTITTDVCDVLGVLDLFCGAASASIPPTFLGICALLV
jgi:hypothetical protein